MKDNLHGKEWSSSSFECCLFASVRGRVSRLSLSSGIKEIVHIPCIPFVQSAKNTGPQWTLDVGKFPSKNLHLCTKKME